MLFKWLEKGLGILFLNLGVFFFEIWFIRISWVASVLAWFALLTKPLKFYWLIIVKLSKCLTKAGGRFFVHSLVNEGFVAFAREGPLLCRTSFVEHRIFPSKDGSFTLFKEVPSPMSELIS